MIDIIVNTYLVLGALFIIVLYIFWLAAEGNWDRKNFQPETETTVINLDTKKSMYLLDHNEAVIPVDVRSAKAFAKAHLPHAVSSPFADHDIERSTLEKLDRDIPVLLYCEGGFHSRCAIEILKEMGFRTVYHLNRGFKSWKFFGGQTECLALA